MMLTSASSATASPAPIATPLIAETIGFTEESISSTMALGVVPLLDHRGLVGGHRFDHLRSRLPPKTPIPHR